MTNDFEIDQLTPQLSVWHRYDPKVKAELFSTRLEMAGAVFLIDPISVRAPDALAGEARVTGIVVTNGNHARAAEEFSKRFQVPIYLHAEAACNLHGGDVIELKDGLTITPGLTALTIPGAPAGEIALHCDAESGSLIIGDALINMEAQGFAFLPAKYCQDAKLLRRSARKLLDYQFERLLFAHGAPIIVDARSRLAELLHSGGKVGSH